MRALLRAAGPLAAASWILLAVRWFDDGAPLRPAWLQATPAAVLASGLFVFAMLWLYAHRAGVRIPLESELRAGLLLVVGLAVCFRLPLAWWGAEGYTTADGSLSGIMALHVKDGTAHYVFVPSVSYSGSLKSHLAALLSPAFGITRAFTLASLAFYAVFVAALYLLGLGAGGARTAIAAGVWAAFAPTFITWYSLSNDGNYVEVLALGTLALALAARFVDAPPARKALATAAGLILGLAFWCHILAIAHVVVVVLTIVLSARLGSAAPLLGFGAGFALGYLPGLLWNAGHGWASFEYLIPGSYWDSARYVRAAATGGEPGPGLVQRLWLAVTDHGPVLFGYDAGYGRVLDGIVRGFSWAGLVLAAVASLSAFREVARRRRLGALGVLLLFTATSVCIALVALPHVPGNPRYLLFQSAPVAVFVARWAASGWRRAALVALVSFGALGSLGQGREKLRAAAEWRAFVGELEREGVKHCYTDYYQASRITFFSEERVVCSSKLGPTATEYFLEYRERVDRAPEAAIVAVNSHSADRMGRRLQALGVEFERRNLMKPVLLRLSRKVDPQELFPGRDLSPR